MIEPIATYLPLTVLFITAYVMSKAYLTSGAATPLIERMADYTGHRPEQMLLGYLLLVAGFSMILPNVIAAMAFLPILPQFIQRFTYTDETARKRIATAFALATIWGSNIGGMGAMTGGISNAILVVYAKANGVPGADSINFLTWLSFGFPISLILCVVSWIVMRMMLRSDFKAAGIAQPIETTLELKGALGAARTPHHHEITHDQRLVYWSTLAFLIFWVVHSIWDTMSQGGGATARLAPAIASLVFGVVYCWFLIRPRGEKGAIVPFMETLNLPWRGIIFVVVSGAASLFLIWLVDAGKYAGMLARWAHDANVPNIGILFGVMVLVAVATEFLNNIVVALAFFPIIHEVSATLGFHPLALLISASLMSTAPFVLPTGAPSNAIVIGEVRGFQFGMAIRIGFVMAILTAAILTVYGMYVVPRVLGLT